MEYLIIVLITFLILYKVGFRKVSHTEWKMIQTKRMIRDLEPTTWD